MSLFSLIILSETYNHVLNNKPIEGEAVSFKEYKEVLREKFKNANFYRNNYRIELPRDIELAKVSTQICNHFILNKNYSVHLEFYLYYFTFLNLMSNTLGKFKVFSWANWSANYYNWRTKWECDWVPSEILEKLCIHSN